MTGYPDRRYTALQTDIGNTLSVSSTVEAVLEVSQVAVETANVYFEFVNAHQCEAEKRLVAVEHQRQLTPLIRVVRRLGAFTDQRLTMHRLRFYGS